MCLARNLTASAISCSETCTVSIDQRADVLEIELARPHGQEPVGHRVDVIERHGMAGRERRAHLRRARRLDADHTHVRSQRLDGSDDTRDETAAAHRHVDRRHGGLLLEDLQARLFPAPR